MEKMIAVINDNLRSVINGIKEHKLDMEATLVETCETISKKVKEANNYKDEVNNSRVIISSLENDISTLESDLEELKTKYDSDDFKEILVAGNKNIKAKINEKRYLISEQGRIIIDLTDKAKVLKDDLIELREKKIATEDNLAKTNVLEKYFEARINDVIEFSEEHADDLDSYNKEIPQDELIVDETFENVDFDKIDAKVFEEIDEISLEEVDDETIQHVLENPETDFEDYDSEDIEIVNEDEIDIATASELETMISEAKDIIETHQEIIENPPVLESEEILPVEGDIVIENYVEPEFDSIADDYDIEDINIVEEESKEEEEEELEIDVEDTDELLDESKIIDASGNVDNTVFETEEVITENDDELEEEVASEENEEEINISEDLFNEDISEEIKLDEFDETNEELVESNDTSIDFDSPTGVLPIINVDEIRDYMKQKEENKDDTSIDFDSPTGVIPIININSYREIKNTPNVVTDSINFDDEEGTANLTEEKVQDAITFDDVVVPEENVETNDSLVDSEINFDETTEINVEDVVKGVEKEIPEEENENTIDINDISIDEEVLPYVPFVGNEEEEVKAYPFIGDIEDVKSEEDEETVIPENFELSQEDINLFLEEDANTVASDELEENDEEVKNDIVNEMTSHIADIKSEIEREVMALENEDPNIIGEKSFESFGSDDLDNRLAECGLDKSKIDPLDLVVLDSGLDVASTKQYLSIAEKYGIDKERIYESAQTLTTVAPETLDRLLSLLDSIGATSKDMNSIYSIIDRVNVNKLEQNIMTSNEPVMTELLYNSMDVSGDDIIASVLELSSEEAKTLRKSATKEEYAIMNAFPEIVKTNYEEIKKLNVDNAVDCITKYPHRFILAPQAFYDILDKYDTEDLVRCINKNAAVIDKL